MPSWLGGPEIIVIVLVIIVVFGWKKLPDAARSLGRSARIFKAEVEEMKHDKHKPSAAGRETVDGRTVPREGTAPEASDGERADGAAREPGDETPSESNGSTSTRRP